MSKYVSDTMALILRLERRKIPARAKELFNQAEKEKIEIFIPTIVFAELGYLAEKGRIETNLSEARQYINSHLLINEYSLTFQTIDIAFGIDDVPELHDRLIAGSAKGLHATIITNDPDMERSKHVQTLWK